MGGNFVLNTLFKVMDSSSNFGKFDMYVEVLNIEDKTVILGLSVLTKNGLSIDTQYKGLMNVKTDH